MLVLRRSLLRPGQLPVLFWRFVLGTLAIVRLLRRYDADIVHSNTVAVVCGASAAALTATPHLWHVHEHIGDEPRLYRMLIRLMLTIFPGTDRCQLTLGGAGAHRFKPTAAWTHAGNRE